ncbi:MAG: hypothetical protein R6U70_05210 [Bacillota bacterium]
MPTRSFASLAYYVQWHMERAPVPLRDEEPDSYQSFHKVLCCLGELQLNTVEIKGTALTSSLTATTSV